MKKFKIVHISDEIRDIDTGDVVFKTTIPESLIDDIQRHKMVTTVINQVVDIWNKTGDIDENLGSTGELDEYLLNEENCTQEEREIIVESLCEYAHND